MSPKTLKTPEVILTLPEVAEYLKLNPKTIYRLAQRGDLPGFKAGASWRFKLSDIEAWIENNMNTPPRRRHKGD